MNSSRHWFSAIKWLAIAFAAAQAGCSSEPDDVTVVTLPRAPRADRSEPEVSLRITGDHGLRSLIGEHRGKVVLVDFWATWCGPCVEQFPHTVELAGRLRDRGLVVVSVSLDNPSDAPKVREFLEERGAWFHNVLSGYDSPLEATKAFGLPGPVPCYRVYDRESRLHREFSVDPRAAKQFTVADVDAAVEELL